MNVEELREQLGDALQDMYQSFDDAKEVAKEAADREEKFTEQANNAVGELSYAVSILTRRVHQLESDFFHCAQLMAEILNEAKKAD